MRIAVCLAFLMSAALAANIEIDPLSDEFINHINSLQNNWKAGKNVYKNIHIEDIKKKIKISKSKLTPTVHSKDIAIPESFDARTNWPECTKLISQIVDEGACVGAWWAVTVASAMSDRRCIASGGSLQVPVSAENLLACCQQCGRDYKGGDMDTAWDYWAKTGIVTGGRYESGLGCIPYSAQNCDHGHGPTPYVECYNVHCSQPECTSTCKSSSLNYTSELTYGKSRVETFATVEDVQREILQNGPVTALMDYYGDLDLYKKGVYHHVIDRSSGSIGVRIIGWGTENNEPYWLVANTWNEYWGDKGLFKIRRGTNECSIEDQITAAQAKV